MVQSSKNFSITQLKKVLNAQLVELSKLRQHEEPDRIRLEELKEEIRSDGILKLAIAVDINTNVILDGEHRFNVLKELGCKKIPVVFVDYDSPDIKVQAWRKGKQLTKKDVVEAGLSEKKLSPMTTRHMVKICNRLKHISAIQKRVNIPLEKLRGNINDYS